MFEKQVFSAVIHSFIHSTKLFL